MQPEQPLPRDVFDDRYRGAEIVAALSVSLTDEGNDPAAVLSALAIDVDRAHASLFCPPMLQCSSASFRIASWRSGDAVALAADWMTSASWPAPFGAISDS
jgi:hypothetical protein